MTIGSANRVEISYVKETTPGVTPSNPDMKRVRFTGENLNPNNSTVESDEIRSDRATEDLVLVDQSNGGDVQIEWSGSTFDDWIHAALFADAAWTAVDNGGETTIASTATGFTDSADGFVSAGLQVGQFIHLTGFTNSDIDGYYRIVTLAAGEITTYPLPPATESASASVTYKGSTIKSGTTDYSMTVQKAYRDVTPVVYQNFRGMRVGVMSQELNVGSIAQGAFSFLGQSSEDTNTQIAGRTETDAPTTAVMNCVGNVNEITAVGAGITSAVKFTQLGINYDNTLRELKAIGTLGSIEIKAGTINATANANPYFESREMLTAFLANSSFLLSWRITASDGYGYIFSLPNVKFQSQDLSAGSKDTDLVINATVRAILDSSSATTMRVDRFTP